MTRLINYLLSRALVAAYRDKDYRLWIAVARRLAKFAERRARV